MSKSQMDKDKKKSRSKLIHWLSRIGTSTGLICMTWLFLALTGILGGSIIVGVLCALTAYEFCRNSKTSFPTYLQWLLTIASLLMPYFFHRILSRSAPQTISIQIFEIYLAIFLILALSALRVHKVLHLICRSKLFPLWGIALPLSSLMVTAHFLTSTGRDPGKALLWVVIIILITKTTDIGALIFGSIFGKHKLAPKTSPGKTIEGAIGGVCFSILLALFFYWLFHVQMDSQGSISTLNQMLKLIIAAGIISITGILGDLFESSWKRFNEIKDSGACLPGLGGFYDLTDSIILSAPVGYFVFKYFLIS